MLELSKEWNEFKVTEDKLTMAQLCKLIEQNRVRMLQLVDERYEIFVTFYDHFSAVGGIWN